MKEAVANGKLVVAGPDAPDTAVCPDCGTEVHNRHVKRMDRSITYFHRHKRGEGKGCPRRYRPT
ncbi:MAG: hypothetical protein ACOC6F_01360 [bacterium]